MRRAGWGQLVSAPPADPTPRQGWPAQALAGSGGVGGGASHGPKSFGFLLLLHRGHSHVSLFDVTCTSPCSMPSRWSKRLTSDRMIEAFRRS
jgi:hypothetical protein